MAQECLRRSVLVSKRREDVEFSRDELERDTLLVVWDVERRELHGMFKPDVSVEKLPRVELPGYERGYDCQVRLSRTQDWCADLSLHVGATHAAPLEQRASTPC